MTMNRFAAVAYFLLRVVSGAMFIQTGGNILFGWFGGTGQPLDLMSQKGIGGILQFFGGIAIVLGLGTRVAAFLCSGMMAVAFWQFHFTLDKPWPPQNNGMPAVLLCFIFLYMTMQGAGEWSLDAVIRRKRKKA